MATRKKAPAKSKDEAGALRVPPPPPVVEEEAAPVPQAESPPPLPAPNVIWRGEKEPPNEVRIGISKITLPDAETQRAGFYSEHATRLVRQIKDYKFLKPLGK